MKLKKIFWITAIPIFILCNYVFTLFLLRIDFSTDPFQKVSKDMVSIKEPLVFSKNWPNVFDIQKFAQYVGIKENILYNLPIDHPFLVKLDWITKANPYPPLLSEIYNLESQPIYFSFGYIGNDEKYHQITLYKGESDTTPSVLVQKVRGSATGWGDYFIQYKVFLSKVIKETPLIVKKSSGQVMKWTPIPQYPRIDKIEWSTYRGGSYNGFEEIVFPLLATFAETFCVLIFFIVRSRISKKKGVESCVIKL